MRLILTLLVFVYSQIAAAYVVGGIACPASDGSYRLTGYWEDYAQIWGRYHGLSEEAVIELLDKNNAIPFFRDVSIGNLILKVKSETNVVDNMKLRLSESEFADCEGVFYLENNSIGWISLPVFQKLAPFERVVIYLEYLNTSGELPHTKKRSLRTLSAGFYLTEEAQVNDPNVWISNYNNYIGEPDDILINGQFYFIGSSLEFQNEQVHGILSKDTNIHFINGIFYPLGLAEVIVKGRNFMEVRVPRPYIFNLRGGVFKTSHFTLDENQNIRCAYIDNISFLTNRDNEVEVYAPGSSACFDSGFVSKSERADFQLLK